MIPRYSRPEMVAIWSPETKFRIWFEIEAHACDALADDKKPDTRREVYRDKTVPKSRNCPSAYAIGGVVTPAYGSPAPHLVMIQVVSLGFEGNNLRWLAVPVKP